MKSYLRLVWVFLRVGVLNEIQYRVNFFVQILQTLIALATGLVVLSLVFEYADSLNGWSQPELLVVMGVHFLIGGVVKMFIQPNMMRLMDEIGQGTLDYTLTKPENAQLLVSVRELQFWQIVDVLTGLVVLGWGLVSLQASMTAVNMASFLLMLFLGITLMYSFWLMIATVTFWVIRVGNIVLIWQSLYQAGRWPVSIYPGWLRLVLTFLVPVAFAVTIPAETFTGRSSLGLIGFAVGLTAVLFFVANRVWRWGLSNYSGASA